MLETHASHDKGASSCDTSVAKTDSTTLVENNSSPRDKHLLNRKEGKYSFPTTQTSIEDSNLYNKNRAKYCQEQSKSNSSVSLCFKQTTEDSGKAASVVKNPLSYVSYNGVTGAEVIENSFKEHQKWDTALPPATRLNTVSRRKPGYDVRGENSLLDNGARFSFLVDTKNEEQIKIPYGMESETFKVPLACPDDGVDGEANSWYPGKPLRIAFVTWNMAYRQPSMDEIASECIHPNAHLIAIATQENGSFWNHARCQRRWVEKISSKCLKHQYSLLGTRQLWGIHLALFARHRDVVRYVSYVHGSEVRTGFLGACGNKGGVAIALMLSMTSLQSSSTTGGSDRANRSSSTCRRNKAECSGKHQPNNNSLVEVESRSTAPKNETWSSVRSQPDLWEYNDKLFCDDKNLSDNERLRIPSCTALGKLQSKESSVIFQHPQLSDTPCSQNVDTTPRIVEERNGMPSSSQTFSPPESVFTFSAQFYTQDIGQKKRSSQSDVVATNGKVIQDRSQTLRDTQRSSAAPPFLSFLFISAHMTAHQAAVKDRNTDYRRIVRKLCVGRYGKYHRFFAKLNEVLPCESNTVGIDKQPIHPSQRDFSRSDKQSESEVDDLDSSTANKACNLSNRDVTKDFDLTIFGGDLNYRINGTREAIETIITSHTRDRSILINNDQLTLERAKKTVFHHFQEGRLNFNPTYKYEILDSNSSIPYKAKFSSKKSRPPAYCDRVLFKKRQGSKAGHVTVRLYTDVPNVHTSDHHPVVAIIDVGTCAFPGSA